MPDVSVGEMTSQLGAYTMTVSPAHRRSSWLELTCYVGALATLVSLQAWTLRAWIVDDAAISMSYARHLRQTLELIPQEGAPRVEGFSNPLWVLLLAPLSGLPDPFAAAKYLSLGFVLFAALRLSSAVEAMGSRAAGRVAGLLLVLQPSVTIWAQSGLENALTTLLGVELFSCLQRFALGHVDRWWALRAGVVAALLTLNRPEGLAYASLYPLLFLLVPRERRPNAPSLFFAVAIPAWAWMAYEAIRWVYFGAWLPNTYLAKGGVTVPRLMALAALDPFVLQIWQSLFGSMFGYVGQSWGMVALVITGISVWRGNGWAIVLPGALMASAALCQQVLLPADWMEEHRFATAMYPPLCALTAILVFRCLRRPVALAFAVFLVLSSGLNAADRYAHFIDHLPIPASEVEARSAYFEQWGERLGVRRPSLLTADVGGVLWRDRLVAVDLGMLVNRRIAKALGEYRAVPDRRAFHDYLFSEVRPDFVATRAYHAWLAQLDSNPRFRREYVPIREYCDSWVLERYHQQLYAGDYVRRTLVDRHPEALNDMRREAAQLTYPFQMQCPTP